MTPGVEPFYDFILRVLTMLVCLNQVRNKVKFPVFLEYNRENIDKTMPLPTPTRINIAHEFSIPNNWQELIIIRS